ncbi:MAG TPA: beta-N-acetylglucosaminidase domain-containing protein [Candidatus Binatia bacterium]|jgi:hyaluronoglucosaminidase
MARSLTFQRRGIVEGFFGPPWSMKHRAAMFEFGAARGMDTYLYAPKDDPYHREKWEQPYPQKEWKELLRLLRAAEKHKIDFVYAFHPGKGLRFTNERPLRLLLSKAERFYDAGVRTFAILFDDILSRLIYAEDRKQFGGSLARAESLWLAQILERQPAGWRDVEWWICPSDYTDDPMLARLFGEFEPDFLETMAEYLPPSVACFWTGPKVVSKTITSADAQRTAQRIRHRLILWDNYPVNDLTMSGEIHLGPLTGRDPRLPRLIYGYLNNPLLQESLSFIPLGTCFDYAAVPANYDAEKSWRRAITDGFGAGALPHWRAIRAFCERINAQKDKKAPLRLTAKQIAALSAARRYVAQHRREPWTRELHPWTKLIEKTLTGTKR